MRIVKTLVGIGIGLVVVSITYAVSPLEPREPMSRLSRDEREPRARRRTAKGARANPLRTSDRTLSRELVRRLWQACLDSESVDQKKD